jgi:2-polyprenyl-3-methyl-5-hydroxy-6-metoxy-1,4-benzoquinol methylase
MDQATLAAYDADPQAYVDRWLARPEATELLALMLKHFKLGGATADFGSGGGRLTAWLAGRGFRVVGFDASEGLLAQARVRHPQIEFRHAVLPDLRGVEPGSFDNVFCKGVLMHLPRAEIAPAVRSLSALLKPGGVLLLNWRITRPADKRDERGRLYSAFESGVVREALAGHTLLVDEEDERSGMAYHTMLARIRRPAAP